MATKTALNSVENKIPSVSNLFEKSDDNTKVNDIEKKTADHNQDKYITSPEFNKLTSEDFAARLKQTNLASKREDEQKILTDNLSIFNGAKYISLGIFQNYLVFIPAIKHI